jgi:hypothetical protein
MLSRCRSRDIIVIVECHHLLNYRVSLSSTLRPGNPNVMPIVADLAVFIVILIDWIVGFKDIKPVVIGWLFGHHILGSGLYPL